MSRRLAVPAVGAILLSALAVAPAGATDVRLSQGKPVEAPSAESSSLSGEKAVDGVDTTRWASAASTALTAKTESAQGKWPGDAAVTIADESDVFDKNLSGLSFQGADVLWAVKNGPGTLYRLVRTGSIWQLDTADGWSSGKALRYENGSGDPDGEGVVSTPDGVVVATERDGDNSGKSSLKVLRYDVSSSSSSQTLNATAEWDLTRDLPSVSDNSGLEAISWVPDSFLTANGLHDEHTDAPYDPASYANHGGGLYFVGLEDNGAIYAYALNQAGGTYTKVATIATGFPQIMDLEFEPETGDLWAVCDDNCQGKSSTLQISDGRFTVSGVYDRPSQMPDYNNEGFAIAPEGTCAAGEKQVVWADDNSDDGHALRAGTLPCSGK